MVHLLNGKLHTHHDGSTNWTKATEITTIQFVPKTEASLALVYQGVDNPREDLDKLMGHSIRENVLKKTSVHIFYHTMGMIPK